MNRMQFRRRVTGRLVWLRAVGTLAVCVSAIVILTPAALANLPSSKDRQIVPFKSLGGVRLGESFSGAKKAWGKPKGASHCNGTASCSYQGENGVAVFDVGSHGVFDVYIAINLATLHPSWKTPLTAFHTSKGIHLGSTLAAIKAAYPGGGAVNTGGYYAVEGRHGASLFFFIDHDRAGSIGVMNQST